MDIAPHTEDLDLASVNTPEELSVLLRTVHLRADKPSLRALEAQSRYGPTPLSKTVVSEMLRGSRFPRKAIMLGFLQACGIQGDRLETWMRAWERVAERADGSRGTNFPSAGSRADLGISDSRTKRPDKAVPADVGSQVAPHEAETRLLREQVTRLAADNEKLRTQIAAPHGVMADSSRHDDGADDRIPLSPPASRRELGVLLRALREEAGITVDQAAERLLCSASKISRMESSFRSGTLRDVRDLCDLYGVQEGDQRNHLMQLARDSRGQGWWQSYGQGHLSTYIGLENDAVSIKQYADSVIPGLLQTAGYARAVEQSGLYEFSSDEIERKVEVRLTRQRILSRANPPTVHSIIGEGALHRSVGGNVTLRAQLNHIIKISELPNVSLQVIPFETGAHPALGSNFTLLEFTNPVPGLLYAEGTVGMFYVERPADLDRHRRVFEVLGSIALNEEDSIRLIGRLTESLA